MLRNVLTVIITLADLSVIFFVLRQKLESLLKIVRCEIISAVQNDQLDAYVLRFVCFAFLHTPMFDALSDGMAWHL
jgi:Adenosylmethionine decarboxylase